MLRRGHSAVGEWTVDFQPSDGTRNMSHCSCCYNHKHIPPLFKKRKKHCNWNLYCWLREREKKKGPFADVILCQRVFIPDEFSHVGLVEHYYGQGINSPTILRGLCCHTKTLRREIVMKKKKKTAQRAFCFDTLNNRGVVAILCKNTTCRCSNNKTASSVCQK